MPKQKQLWLLLTLLHLVKNCLFQYSEACAFYIDNMTVLLRVHSAGQELIMVNLKSIKCVLEEKLPFGSLFARQIIGSSSGINIFLQLWLGFFHVVCKLVIYVSYEAFLHFCHENSQIKLASYNLSAVWCVYFVKPVKNKLWNQDWLGFFQGH